MKHLALFIYGTVLAGQAQAFAFDMDGGDLRLRFNNTLRYNWAQRMQNRDSRIANNGAYDQGDAYFARNDTIANRLDWLGEFDLFYLDNSGLRITASAWYDGVYGRHGSANPGALPSAAPSYSGNSFTPYVKRYYHGPSGEFLDAFTFTAIDIGDSVWNLKAGRHAVVWGESMFGSTHSVAYAQTPSDGMKAVTNPGASAKETALPINQFSLLAQIDPELSLLGQYLFEWRPNRLPEGGTYFGVADSVLEGPDVNRLPALKGQRGDWGLGLKWSPAWLDGTLGAYVRRFDDKAGWVAQSVGGGITRAVYAKEIDLWGVTLAKNIAGIAVGAEISHRHNDPLTSDAANSDPATSEGARGDTWHGLANGVLALGPTSFFDLASVSGELAWSRLDRVTRNPSLYRARGYLATCNTLAKVNGCADEEYFGAAISFIPVWLQVFPGVDVEMPVFYSVGLKGNAPGSGGGSEGSVVWKVGLTAKAYARHQFDLAYTGYDQKLQTDPASPYGSRVLGAPFKDKDWLSFTYQTTF
ncbi:MAG: DUF1302 family protein [Georgfuchsia sp.]